MVFTKRDQHPLEILPTREYAHRLKRTRFYGQFSQRIRRWIQVERSLPCAKGEARCTCFVEL